MFSENDMNTNTEKQCSKCQQIKPLDEFFANKNTSDGLAVWCKECLVQNRKRWVDTNPGKLKTYYSTPEAKSRIRQYKRQWDKQYLLNPLNRLNNNIRGNMHHALKAKKGFRKWENLVGYTLEDLIKHLTPLLKGKMVWDNYGAEWHVDHITPKSWFKYTSTDDPQFKACWALSNLQPKLRLDNIRKGNRFKG